jgi:flagellin-specific chaperone FliS
MPVRRAENVIERLSEELRLVHKWEGHLMNDAFGFSSRKAEWAKEGKETNRKWRGWIERVVEGRSDVYKMKSEQCWALIEAERCYRLSGLRKKKFEGQVIGRLNRDDERIRSKYGVNVQFGDWSECKLMKKIKNDMRWKLGTNLGRFVKERLSCVRTKGVTIRNVVSKRMEVHKEFGVRKFECRCEEYLDDWKVDGHVCMRSRDMYGLFKEYLGECNNGTMLSVRDDMFRRSVKDEVRKLYRLMKIKMSRSVELELENVKLSGGYKYDYRELNLILDELGGLVMYPLDKNDKTYGVMCERRYGEELDKAYGVEMKQYVEVEESEEEVKRMIEKNLKKTLVSRLRKKKEWELDVARIVMKNKDLMRYRPIVSSVKGLDMEAGDKCSRALTILVRWLRLRWNTMSIENNLEVIKRVENMNGRDRWKEVIESRLVTYVELDMKNQYTNLEHKDILDGMMAMMRECVKGKIERVYLARVKADKELDTLVVHNNKKCYMELSLV